MKKAELILTAAFGIAAAALASGEMSDPCAADTGWKFALGDGAVMIVKWSDGSVNRYPMRAISGGKYGHKLNAPDWAIEWQGGFRFYSGPSAADITRAVYSVRPDFHSYATNWKMQPEGVALTNDWSAFPAASEKPLRYDLVTDEFGGRSFWINGSWMTGFAETNKNGAAFAALSFTRMDGSEIAPVASLFAENADHRFLPLALAETPRPGSFTNAVVKTIAPPDSMPWLLASADKSSDAAICRQVLGRWALECDGYTRRSPAHGYPYAIHFRLPPRVYRRAHAVFALENDEKKFDRVANFRIGCYFSTGSGSRMYADSTLDLTKGIGESVKKIGEVERGGETLGVYYAAVDLRYDKVIDVPARYNWVDFEVLGPVDGENNGDGRRSPKKKHKSAFHFLGLTLEKAPIAFDEVSDPGHPFCAWTVDEKPRRSGFKVKAQLGAEKVEASWKVVDLDGKTVMKRSESIFLDALGDERTVALDLEEFGPAGLYRVPIKLATADGFEINREMRFAVLADSHRDVGKESAPWCAWVWHGGPHGTPSDWTTKLAPLKRVGIRKVSNADTPRELLDKYDLTFAGFLQPLPGKEFDAKSGRFLEKDGKDGETRFVEDLRAKIAKAPYVDHVMIWHENAPNNDGHLPQTLFGFPVPEPSPAQREKIAYFNECGRIIRKHFPGLKIQAGNSGSSIGAMGALVNYGANLDYLDVIGDEETKQYFHPERLGGCNTAPVVRGVIEERTGRPQKVSACYEWASRVDRQLGERLHAAWSVRDALVALCDDYTLIPLPAGADCRYTYSDTLWGEGGMAKRLPYCHPKETMIAVSALTKAMDGVKFLRHIDTGSSTVYAPTFRRTDGRYATALWCSRGEATVEVEVDGDGIVMDMFGRETPLKKGFLFKIARASGGECPSYVITDNEIRAIKIVERRFPREERLAASGAVGGNLADSSPAVTTEPALNHRRKDSFPLLITNDHFNVSVVKDPERGKALEVRHDETRHDQKQSKWFTEVTTLKLAKPIEIPGEPAAIGVWVKGNSNFGAIRFEVTDAKGYVWSNTHISHEWNPFDWAGTQCVDFDGWAFITSNFYKGHFHYDEHYGFIGNATSWPWRFEREKSPGGDPGAFTYPLKLTAISIEYNPEKISLNRFLKSSPELLFGDVVGVP